ncbi:MAG: amino acid ABC transporter substrate-binding protein [Bacteroidetes bacterium]|nr:amino acid ABC transporter substrate-binding protein [Bacteroidota bacterium]
MFVLLSVLYIMGFFSSIFSVGEPLQIKNLPTENTVNIGLLIPQPKEKDPLSLAAYQGAKLAIDQANAKGGFNGRSFELKVQSCDGPWGAGIKAGTKLVYEDEVWAILGSLDGRNAHLAEQVITKSHIVLLCSRSSDPTLSRINIPWFFRIVPDDRQQATILVREIFKVRNLKNVATIAPDDYDGKMAVEAFVKTAKNAGYSVDNQLYFKPQGNDIENLITQLKKTKTKNIILFGTYSFDDKIVRKIKQIGSEMTLFSNLSFNADNKLPSHFKNGESCQNCIFPDFNKIPGANSFHKSFQQSYRNSPNITAAFAYDGMNLIIKAIKKAGLDKEQIRDTIKNINSKEFVSGEIRFDSSGNRIFDSELFNF